MFDSRLVPTEAEAFTPDKIKTRFVEALGAVFPEILDLGKSTVSEWTQEENDEIREAVKTAITKLLSKTRLELEEYDIFDHQFSLKRVSGTFMLIRHSPAMDQP